MLSTAVASSVFAFVALAMLSVGLRGTGFGGPVVSALWPGMAAITALVLAIVLTAAHASVLAVRMPQQQRESLAAVAAGDVLDERPTRPWSQARYRCRVIGGFGLPLGLLLLGVGRASGGEQLLWAGGLLAAVAGILLVLAAWISRRMRSWHAEVLRARKRRAAATRTAEAPLWSEAAPYQPFEQLREMLHAAPARLVSASVLVGFIGLVALMLFNLGVLGNEAGFAPADLNGEAADAETSAVVGWLLAISAAAFAVALLVALADVVRSVARGTAVDPLELLAHPFAAFGVAGIAVGLAFVLVWPGQVPVGATEDHLAELQQWWWAGAAGIAALAAALVLGVAGAAPRRHGAKRPQGAA